jgi:hypothetical protein
MCGYYVDRVDPQRVQGQEPILVGIRKKHRKKNAN